MRMVSIRAIATERALLFPATSLRRSVRQTRLVQRKPRGDNHASCLCVAGKSSAVKEENSACMERIGTQGAFTHSELVWNPDVQPLLAQASCWTCLPCPKENAQACARSSIALGHDEPVVYSCHRLVHVANVLFILELASRFNKGHSECSEVAKIICILLYPTAAARIAPAHLAPRGIMLEPVIPPPNPRPPPPPPPPPRRPPPPPR